MTHAEAVQVGAAVADTYRYSGPASSWDARLRYTVQCLNARIRGFTFEVRGSPPPGVVLVTDDETGKSHEVEVPDV